MMLRSHTTIPRPSLLIAAFSALAFSALSGCSSSGNSSDDDGGSGTGASGGSTATGGAGGTGGSGASGGSGGSGGGGAVITENPWVNLYYPGWTAEALPPAALPFDSITHIIHFAWVPVATGSGIEINDQLNVAGLAGAQAIIHAGHEHDKPVLIAIGGAGRGSEHFGTAIADENRSTFIADLVQMTLDRGYDGIDIDMESFDIDAQDFQDFSRELREYMDANAPELSLIAAVLGAQAYLYGPIADVYDQINIMSYDLVWGTPKSWHNSPLRGGVGAYYSVDRAAREYESAGIPKANIGVGIKCGGYRYSGITAPIQDFAGSPSSISYVDIMAQHFSENAYVWDERSEVPYLSITSPSPTYITYDDVDAVKVKMDYVRTGGYGGVIIWDASDGYFPQNPEGERHPLIEATKAE